MKNILIKARAKIATPETWTQGVLARDADNNAKPMNHPLASNIFWDGIDGRDPLACKFCALGAAQAATPDDDTYIDVNLALNKAAEILFGTYDIAEVNDEYGHDAVLQCYDHAIGAAT